MKTVEQLALATNSAYVRAFGAIRRFAITLTDRALWQIAGVMMPDGRETLRAEVFGGVGFYARPPADSDPEAIVAMGGGATNPAIVAVRDEKTRAAVAGDLQPDETALFNSKAIAKATAAGKIECRSPTGVATPLALNADLAQLITKMAGVAPGVGSGDAAIAALQAYVAAHPQWPAGTTVLEGE